MRHFLPTFRVSNDRLYGTQKHFKEVRRDGTVTAWHNTVTAEIIQQWTGVARLIQKLVERRLRRQDLVFYPWISRHQNIGRHLQGFVRPA